MNLPSRVDQFFFEKSSPRQIHGLRVAVSGGTRAEEELALDKIEAALALIATHSPCRIARLLRHARGIFVVVPLSNNAEWKRSLHLVYIDRRWLLSDECTRAVLAGALIHEATHGWLFHLGIGYEPPIRARVEAVCARAALGFAKHAPDAAELSKGAEWQLTRHPGFWSEDSMRRRQIWEFVAFGFPLWVASLLRARYRMSPGLTVTHSPNPCDRVEWDPERGAYIWSYTTEVRNDTDVPLRVMKFWASYREHFRWWSAAEPDDKPLEEEEFARAFELENAWIAPRSSVISTRLSCYNESPSAWKMRWRFLAEDAEEMHYLGDGIIRLSRAPAAVRRRASAGVSPD